jgi:hypothetical protein
MLVLTGEGINFTVSTVDDFPTLNLEDNLVCIVTDENRGGTFIYRSAKATINNEGTIFDGWERQFSGPVNVKWFGAKGDGIADDTIPIQKAVNYIVSIHPTSPTFYNNRNAIDIELNNGNFVINGKILFTSGIRFIGNNCSITTTKTTFEAIFSSAYLSNGVLVSLDTLTDKDLLTQNSITNVLFENIIFKDIPLVLKLTAVLWQSCIKDCSFYYCGRAIDSYYSFYMKYENIKTYGKKTGYDSYSMVKLASFVNHIELDNVSITSFGTTENNTTGTGLEIVNSNFSIPIQNSGGGFQNISLNNCSFESGKYGIVTTGEGHGLNIQNTYVEKLDTFIKDTDGAIKTGVTLNVEAGWQVKNVVNMSGLRSSILYPFANKDDGTPALYGKTILYAGTNGNYGTIVYRDSRWGYDSTKYSLTPEVSIYDFSGGAMGFGTVGNKNWNPAYKAMQFGKSGVLYSSTNEVHLQENAYRNTSDTEKRIIAGKASKYVQVQGIHLFYSTNTSDTADSNITDMNEIIRFSPDGTIASGFDNTKSMGSASNRWSVIYAGTGTINTSDDREKTYIDITAIEKKVAIELKANMRKFKFNHSIEEKGEERARIHFGASAQTVKSIFEKHGLNAFDYAILCYDEWDDLYETILLEESILDEEGNEITPAKTKEVLTRPAGNKYGLRYEELLSFIIGCI